MFNVAGDKHRIVVRIDYPYRVVYIRLWSPALRGGACPRAGLRPDPGAAWPG